MTEAGVRMCHRVTAAVAAVVPPGVGRWEKAWALTAEPERRFMAALERWDRERTRESDAALKEAFDSFVRAWETVSKLWKEQTS